MLIFYGLLAAFAVIHAVTYAAWLKKNDYKHCIWIIYGLSAMTLGLYGFVFIRKIIMGLLGYGE